MLPRVFRDIASANIARVEKLQASSTDGASVELVCSDARRLVNEYSLNGKRDKPLADNSVRMCCKNG